MHTHNPQFKRASQLWISYILLFPFGWSFESNNLLTVEPIASRTWQYTLHARLFQIPFGELVNVLSLPFPKSYSHRISRMSTIFTVRFKIMGFFFRKGTIRLGFCLSGFLGCALCGFCLSLFVKNVATLIIARYKIVDFFIKLQLAAGFCLFGLLGLWNLWMLIEILFCFLKIELILSRMWFC